MWKGLSLKCKIAGCVAIFFLGVACFCFAVSAIKNANFWHRVRFGCLMALRVDFSAPGAYMANFNSPADMKGAFLGLDVPDSVLSDMSADVLLSGLEGNYTILGAGGKKVFSGLFTRDSFEFNKESWKKNIIDFEERLDKFFHELPEGKCQITVTITEGANNLKSIPQRLILVGDSIGFGLLDIRLHIFFGCVLLLLAIIILFIVAIVSRRKMKLIESSTKVCGTATSSLPVSEEQV